MAQIPVLEYAAESEAFGAREAKDKSMAELNLKETQQLLAGTWIGIACVAELLIERKVISRDDLTAFLWTTERMTSDRCRRDGLAVVRRLIEQGLGRDLSREDDPPSTAVIEQVIHEVLVPAVHPRQIDPYGPDKVIY
jgi:hypothetical protein